MQGEMDVDSLLDYALFKVSSTENSYEALICTNGKPEKLASGQLDHLAMHLPQANKLPSSTSRSSFKLQLSESIEVSSWFSKFTLASFLHMVNSPEVMRSANAIESEMSQLEDTRRFHLSLYYKDHQDLSGGVTTGGSLKDVRSTQDAISKTASSDATKNKLLRAMDLRIMALKEELGSLLNKAASTPLSTKQISNLAAFAQHFGARDLRNPLLKYLSLIPKDQMVEDKLSTGELISDQSRKHSEENTDQICQTGSEIGKGTPVSNGISPAVIAQAERQSSSESDSSSESSEDRTSAERSRPVIRSASPRRSASPMRRVQIGRSGSRRSTAIAIKSLNYFPVRERLSSNRDADENNSGDEESEPASKKPENTVRRMSVQDAISLFESKQKEQNSDIQKKNPSGDVSSSANKAVLRRWSAGMGDSLVRSEDIASETTSQSTSVNVVPEAVEHKMTDVKAESDSSPRYLDAVDSGQLGAPSEEANAITSSNDDPTELITSQDEKVNDRTAASAEWTRQKEAELNQMLVKMMENKPGKYRTTSGYGGTVAAPNEQRGGLYSQYKEKRDEKLRAENAGKRLVSEAKYKVLQENFEQSKVGMVSKSGVNTKKIDSSSNAQRARRNSSPPVLPKKEVSKVSASRKASPKSSPLPTTRASWSSGPLPKTSGTQQAKSSPRITSANTMPTRRKSLPTPSPTPPSPKTGKPLHQPKGNQGAKINAKPTMKTQEEKKQKSTLSASKSAKPRAPSASGDDSGMVTGKPSFYSKVTKKSSVVPLEVKPFLKKGTGVGPGVGPVLSKNKGSHNDDSSKKSGDLIQVEEKGYTSETPESMTKPVEVDHAEPNEVSANLEISSDIGLNLETTEKLDQDLVVVDDGFGTAQELPVVEIQPDEDISISSAAWVDIENQEVSTASETVLSNVTVSPVRELQALSSPRVRHSLSQMLQADNNEPEIIEWGNAENPPALVYQKDAPKGFKRLLKFARKSKADANVTGCASPSVFSEGEDDTEDSRGGNKKNFDTSRKGSLQAKGFGQQKTMLNEALDSGNLSKRTTDYHDVDEALSAQLKNSNLSSLSSDKLRDVSSTAPSTKASRSFFSLSTFRSSKSSETKLW